MYAWGDHRRFNSYSGYFRRTFGGRVQKISVDAGFTCPNRDGKIGEADVAIPFQKNSPEIEP